MLDEGKPLINNSTMLSRKVMSPQYTTIYDSNEMQMLNVFGKLNRIIYVSVVKSILKATVVVKEF